MNGKSNRYKRYMISWCIGIRKRQTGVLTEKTPFLIIRNPKDGWMADPYLFEHEGKTYIFAEQWNYKKQKGIIAVTEFSGTEFCEWRQVIEEDYHMSYPVLWSENGRIYLCAETSSIGRLYIYVATNFPYEWEVSDIVSEGRFADSTPLFKNGKIDYFFTCELSISGYRLLRGKMDKNGKIDSIDWRYVTRDAKLARPGGAFINVNNRVYRVAQDCSDSYGKNINICEVLVNNENEYVEELIKSCSYDDIQIIGSLKNVIGMHTYNISDNYEVVDFRMKHFGVRDYLGSITKFRRSIGK